MTNIQQLTLDLMLAHNIDYIEAHNRAYDFCSKSKIETPPVLVDDWISVDDRLPEKQGLFLVYDKCDNRIHVDCLPLYYEVTHWQPLPQPPKN